MRSTCHTCRMRFINQCSAKEAEFQHRSSDGTSCQYYERALVRDVIRPGKTYRIIDNVTHSYIEKLQYEDTLDKYGDCEWDGAYSAYGYIDMWINVDRHIKRRKEVNMGYFTWNYATISSKRSSKESMSYDGKKPIFLALPNGDFIEEKDYGGYGIIGLYDVHEMVVDWNFEEKETIDIIDVHLQSLNKEKTELESQSDEDSTFRLKFVKGQISRYEKIKAYFLGNDSTAIPIGIDKRDIGIMISTYDWEIAMLKYPLKFVKNKTYSYHEIKGYSSKTQ